jgi:hypothetical protein
MTFLSTAPRLIQLSLSSLLSFASNRTNEAILLFGFDKAEWSEALRRQIPPSQLPVQYGGFKNVSRTRTNASDVWNWDNPVINQIFKDFQAGNKTVLRCDIENEVFPAVNVSGPLVQPIINSRNVSSLRDSSNIIPRRARTGFSTASVMFQRKMGFKFWFSFLILLIFK